MTQKTVSVPNISCGHCVATIEREIGTLEGVIEARADAGSKMVSVKWDDSAIGWAVVSARLEAIHFPAAE